MGVDEMLAQFGITQTTLSPHEREALDREGYVVLPGVIDADWLERLTVMFESSVRSLGEMSFVFPGSRSRRLISCQPLLATYWAATWSLELG